MSRQFTEKQAIINLQTYLRAQGALYPELPQVPIDGIFDTATRTALIDFQLRNGLQPTGIADKRTWELLYAQYLDILSTSSLPNPIIPFPSYPNGYEISLGEKSFLVATLQYMLNEIALVYTTLEPPKISGEYDLDTENAVKKFQKSTSLLESGRVDLATWNAIARIYNLSLHYIDQY